MKPLPRRPAWALAAAAALALFPAAVSGAPASERATGGPGASAALAHGVLTVRRAGTTVRMHVPDGYELPVVTTRGRRGGVSFDGRTVVLAASGAASDGRSRFLVADGGRLTPLVLRGRLSFDAVAPHGSALYFIRRISAADPTRYVVLEYNRASRQLTKVFVKVEVTVRGPSAPDEETMQGLPLARATASDGRWVFTLYDSREHPFIHALPLGQGAWAACIELPPAWRSRVSQLRLRARGAQTVQVLDRAGNVVATAGVDPLKLSLP
jgi:hypothetical protein